MKMIGINFSIHLFVYLFIDIGIIHNVWGMYDFYYYDIDMTKQDCRGMYIYI